MAITLDCGIEFPDVARNVEHKPTKEDYERCLSRLVEVLGNTTGQIVGYIHHNPYIALRFLGELRIQKFIRYEYSYRGRVGDDKDDAMKLTEARVKPTVKLLAVPVEEIHNVPREPVFHLKKNSAIQVRRGLPNNHRKLKQSREAIQVIKDIQQQEFVINTFILDILAIKPALLSTDDGYIMYERCLHYAYKFKDGKPFKFPNYLCSRGRTYDETTVGFSPQGADHEKALVLPYYEEPLTEDGYTALIEAAHGYSEIEWSVEEMISHAQDPIGTHYIWKKADSKYSYIACAELIRRYNEDPTQPLPAFTPLDGRCSGLQHWSALTRSNAITNRLGMEVNDAEDGLDIYEYVAEMWKQELPIDYQHYATRKAAKVPTMTWGYNATRMTSIEHISDLFGEKSEWDDMNKRWRVCVEGLPRATTAFLGSDLYNRLHEILAPLSEAVQWVSQCAKKINRETINWVTPDGFIGQQKKVKQEEIRPKVGLSDGSTIGAILKIDTKQPDKRRHASSLSPNIIHSLDACHLRMVARRLTELGLPMVFIHDSFATHSNHRHTLYRIIVEEFIKLYSGEYLWELKEQWENLYEVELPEPPAYGDWDVKVLDKCTQFFA